MSGVQNMSEREFKRELKCAGWIALLLAAVLGLFCGTAKAQNTTITPDCQIFFNFTAAGNSGVYQNFTSPGGTGGATCTTWTVAYAVTGFSALSLTFQSAPALAGSQTTPGTWGTYGGTVLAGINPNTSATTGAQTTFSNVAVSTPFLRVNLAGLTGSGRVWGTFYGYKSGYLGSGGFSGLCPNGAAAGEVLFSNGTNCDGDPNFVWNASTGLILGRPITATAYNTATNCADSAGAAACGSAAAGAFVVDAAAVSTVVSTTAVTANSEIAVHVDSGLGTRLGVTCNTLAPVPVVTARTAATSFTVTVSAAPVTNPACLSYTIVN